MADLLRLYHRLPYGLRVAAASLRGFYLRSWRYTGRTEGLVKKALARERWSAADWKAWQAIRLKEVLNRAARRVPYYREYWAGRDGALSLESLENWPPLEKEDVRENPRAFVADDCDLRRMYPEHTSGTTGKSLDLWRSRAVMEDRYALFEARVLRWNSFTPR